MGSDSEAGVEEGALVAASDHPYTLQRLEETSWWSLLERARRGPHLQELRRFLYHPQLTFLENQLRVLDFLRWLGRVRRRRQRDTLGLLVYGEAGVGRRAPFCGCWPKRSSTEKTTASSAAAT